MAKKNTNNEEVKATVKEEMTMTTESTMTNAEILASVDAGDYEAEEINEALTIDYNFDNDESEEVQAQETTATTKASKKEVKIHEKDIEKLANALEVDGKMLVSTTIASDNCANYMLIQNGYKKVRIYVQTLDTLLAKGKVEMITQAQLDEMISQAKAEKAQAKAQAKAEKAQAKAKAA